MITSKPGLVGILLLILFTGCQTQNSTYQELAIPELSNGITGEPNLTQNPDGSRLYLSWVEETSDTTAQLWYATLDQSGLHEGRWSRPTLLLQGTHWFVNWADFPSLLVDQQGVRMMHWLQKIPGGTYAYHVNLKRRLSDNSWSDPITPHKDGSPTEHGFVSLSQLPTENSLAIWLDGRAMADEDPPHAMTLRSTEITPTGAIQHSHLIDNWVCDCCQTDATSFDGTVLTAYRNRTPNEIRDIALAAYHPQTHQWDTLGVIWPDQWEIGGCPVNGPALASDQSTAGLAWFTQARDTAKVQLGVLNKQLKPATEFSEPIRIDEGNPLGRIDVVTTHGGYLVTWVEQLEEQTAQIMGRFVSVQGNAEPAVALAAIDPSRRSGFPRVAILGNDLVISLTKVQDEKSSTKIESLSIPLTELINPKTVTEKTLANTTPSH
ncbi:MAG: hypothetical protein ACQETE_12285 [Bacteroidota bacterium]